VSTTSMSFVSQTRILLVDNSGTFEWVVLCDRDTFEWAILCDR